MLTLAEVLELPVVRRALPEVIAGADALDRELRWAHVIEMADEGVPVREMRIFENRERVVVVEIPVEGSGIDNQRGSAERHGRQEGADIGLHRQRYTASR